MLTQKYKQQQQQLRVLTNESNYLKGMYFSDIPLSEGYSRLLVNFDIDQLSGALKPRKGLQSLGLVFPENKAKQDLNKDSGFNVIVDSKVCAVSDGVDSRKINRYLQAILYNTDTRTLLTATCAPDMAPNSYFKTNAFSLDFTEEYITPEPYVIAKPSVHGKPCVHNHFFKHPVGAFAFEDGFYTFLKHSRYAKAQLIAELPNTAYKTNGGTKIQTYNDLKNNSKYNMGIPGRYFKFISGDSIGVIAYYTEEGVLQTWGHGEALLQEKTFTDLSAPHTLCYTKLGAEILKAGDTLLDTTLLKSELDPDKYYVCVITPQRLNPTEASSWGYNMLAEDPYDFECETTAVNLVTILGILPYDKSGKIVLTPRKNQEITLKGYYRAPAKYCSDSRNPRFYATAQQKIGAKTTVTRYKEDDNSNYSDGTHVVHYGYITVNGVIAKHYYYIKDNKTVVVDPSKLIEETITVDVQRDPSTKTELDKYVTNLTPYKFGDWWYCTDEKKYYMVMPGTKLSDKNLALFGDTQPPASVSLNVTAADTSDDIRVKWEMRSAGAATWTTLSDEVFKLEDYYKQHGDHAPFTYTGTMPSDEVLIKLTILDPKDVAANEEFVLSTNTIGLSLVSDDLANTLNLETKNYSLGRCTGMCEWEQRLVLWGVPDALNTLFVSDVNNPTFFPYPNNVDIFPDPIISVHKYGAELLVLTTAALYRLSWNTDGLGWTHTLVQQNLHVTEEDTYMSCVIKNMFFFKSGEYFYMMVPKASSSSVRGEVAIAPISKIIANLLDNFHQEVYNLIKVMSDNPQLPDFTEKLVNYFSYVDNTRVVVNYVYALDDTTSSTNAQEHTTSKYLYVQLIYDTEARTWSMRAFEAPHMLYASHADAIQQDRFIDITPALNGDQLVLQYYKFIDLNDTAIQYVDAGGKGCYSNKLFKNYQYLDTGNREINTELKKRFREFQFKIKNGNATNLGFFTSFLIDGSLRKDLQRYSPRLISDASTNETTLVVERVLDTTTMSYKTTRVERIIVPERMLQDNGELTPTILADENDPDRWILDQSAFPGRTLWKIRMPISGKGYAPRAILLSTNEAEYTLFGHAWAYRTMNSR
jgi:hypothetical protein